MQTWRRDDDDDDDDDDTVSVSVTAVGTNPIDLLTVGFDFAQLTYRITLPPSLLFAASSHLSSLKAAVRRGYQRKSRFNETQLYKEVAAHVRAKFCINGRIWDI